MVSLEYTFNMQIYQSRPLHLLYPTQAPQEAILVSLNTPGPAKTQSLLELFKLANPKLFTMPCLAFPSETLIAGSGLTFPLLPPAGVFPGTPGSRPYLLSLGSVNTVNLCFP